MLLGRYVCQSCRNFARVGVLDTRASQYFLGASVLPSRFRQGECNSQQVVADLMLLHTAETSEKSAEFENEFVHYVT